MPIITDYNEVKKVYKKAADLGIAMPVFCAEDRETLEAILASALEYGKKIGVKNIPIIPAWTSRYPARGQLKLLSACGEPRVAIDMMFSDLEIYAGENSPYKDLIIMPHLDHAFPWLDEDILLDYADKFASVMCDASERDFETNIAMTKGYVDKVKGRVVVEGAVDEIFEAGGGDKNEATSVEQAKRFIEETGVDIIVPNVGTEHRATADKVKYLSENARMISKEVGKVMCIHGTSSVKPEDLSLLPQDGFVKVNVYTTLAVHGGQALAQNLLSNLGNIFNEEQLKQLVNDGVLGQAVLKNDYANTQLPIKPKLEYVTNPLRRDAWFNAVKNRCMDFLEIFNYKNFAE